MVSRRTSPKRGFGRDPPERVVTGPAAGLVWDGWRPDSTAFCEDCCCAAGAGGYDSIPCRGQRQIDGCVCLRRAFVSAGAAAAGRSGSVGRPRAGTEGRSGQDGPVHTLSQDAAASRRHREAGEDPPKGSPAGRSLRSGAPIPAWGTPGGEVLCAADLTGRGSDRLLFRSPLDIRSKRKGAMGLTPHCAHFDSAAIRRGIYLRTAEYADHWRW